MCRHVTVAKGERALIRSVLGSWCLWTYLLGGGQVSVTQLPETDNGNTCIVVFVDRLSKMVHVAAAPTAHEHMNALSCSGTM